MPTNSRKERMALLLQEIIDDHVAPEKQHEPIVAEARQLLAAYWQSRDATRRDAWNREPAWIRNLKNPTARR